MVCGSNCKIILLFTFVAKKQPQLFLLLIDELINRKQHCRREKMMAVPFILLVASAAVSLVDGEKECPPWFEWVNTTDSSRYCACANKVPRCIECDQINQMSWLAQGACTFYGSEDIGVFWCQFLFPKGTTKNGLFPIHSNVSELNSVVCGNLSREVKGPLCGRCTNGTGPSIYSVGSRCAHCSPVNILYYLLLQYLPSTVIFLLVIIFRPNITSAPMANYVLLCNCTVFYLRFGVWLYIQLESTAASLAKTAITLTAVWSFDALLFISPPICISQHMEEVYIPFLEFIAAIYPFILLMLTYGVIKLHTKNFKPVVFLWRVFRRILVRFYRAWDPRSSMIQAFASLFFLSYARLSSIVWEPFLESVLTSSKGHAKKTFLYIDPNVPLYSTKHILLMAFSVFVAVFVFLPPLLILAVYPTSLYRKISHRIQPKWRLRIKTYVETFHSSFKDGTNGTRDYRLFSGLFIFCLSLFPQLLHRFIAITIPSSENLTNNFTTSDIMAIFTCAVALFCILLQPYKTKIANNITTGLFIIFSLMFANLAGIYNTQGSNAVKVIILILLLVPHCALWGYITWRFIKSIPTYCCRKGNGEGDGILTRFPSAK